MSRLFIESITNSRNAMSYFRLSLVAFSRLFRGLIVKSAQCDQLNRVELEQPMCYI
jgi:hypothetical protein